MDLSIILLNYKSRGLIRQCVKGILAAAPRLDYEIIVVDNDSKDGVEKIKEECPAVKFIAAEKNIGFGPGNNLGIREACGRYVLLLNPDTAILDDVLEKIVAFMDATPDVGITGPKLVNPDKSLQYSCYLFPSLFVPMYRRTFFGKNKYGTRELDKYLMKDWDHGSVREVDWLLGACIILRREMLEKIGLFDERFFLYFEDTDLCRRAWEAGWKVVYNPSLQIVHYHHRESAEGSFWQSLTNRVTRIHIYSWIKYLLKYRGKRLPR